MYAIIEGDDIKLYGTIYHGDGQYVVSQLSKKLADTKAKLAIHLHTDGGSVFDGNLIYNAIAAAKAEVTIYVDGLAASMGSIIMLAGKTIKMAENAYIMIHAPSGYQHGNAKDFQNTAKLLLSMEANFIKKYSARSSQTPEEIKDLMNGDNWFSADEAQAAGLIDEIVDSVFEESNLSAYQDVKMCAQLFSAFNTPKEEEPQANITNPKPKEMKLSAESITALGLSADASDAEINAAIDAQNKKVTELTAKADQEHASKCERLVATAISEGRILAGEKEAWTADAKANFELAERMIAKLPKKENLNASETSIFTADGTEKWTKDDWRKKNPSGFLQMKKEDPERYAALWNA